MMSTETKEYLHNLYIYLRIMNNINRLLKRLISNNVKNTPEKNIDMFYLLTVEILRIIPYKISRDEINVVLNDDGIVKLKNELTFIETEYNKILQNPNMRETLMNVLRIRNKSTHEPHNLSFAFSVSGKTSCSVSIYYKEELRSLSTIELEALIKKLNNVFDKIRNEFLTIVRSHEKEYKKYPVYKKVLSYRFEKYNKDLIIMPKYN